MAHAWNGCSLSSRFLSQARRIVSSGDENDCDSASNRLLFHRVRHAASDAFDVNFICQLQSKQVKRSSHEWINKFITCRAKLLNADWLRQRAFLLNQEGTFGNQDGMITWCWLAERTCIELVSRFKRSLKRNFRNASLLSLILTRSFHVNVKENQHATKRSLLVEKQRDFSEQNCIDLQPENSFEWGRLVLNEALDRTSWPPNWKLTSSFCYKSPA